MRPIDFPESTKVLQKPAEMNDQECRPLPVWGDGKQIVSKWKANFKERIMILFTGNVWLGVLSGNTQPPVWVDGCRPFVKAPLKARISDFVRKIVEFIMDKWENLANGIKQPDKRKRLIASFAISLACGIFCPLAGVITAIVAGALKEWWNPKGRRTIEALDFIVTCLGALCALPFSCIIHHLIF